MYAWGNAHIKDIKDTKFTANDEDIEMVIEVGHPVCSHGPPVDW